MIWDPRSWASWIPQGIGHVKPHHLWETLKTAWENRGALPYALRILRRGVCDGCALGTSGLKDHTIDGLHLCTIRLGLLRLNTMPALDLRRLRDAGALKGLSGRDLRKLGRLAHPMERRRGEAGFRRIGWDEALDAVAGAIRASVPERVAFFITSRGITNEAYYAVQKAARSIGTNNVDNSARLCHSPSTVAMKRALGVAASTCSYKDWLGADLIVFFGSNAAGNQPVSAKYLYYAKKRGARVAVVNPYREPGLERYWVPSVPESALFGTRLTDAFFQVGIGGDAAFLNGVLKHLIANGWVDREFIRDHTSGWEELAAALEPLRFEDLERQSGSTRWEMLRFAALLSQAKNTVFVWSMGLTQHAGGADNVAALINVALARGYVGRELNGLMPVRGHSGVQGGAEVGAVPNAFPGGLPVNEENARRMEALWGFPVPAARGLDAVEMIDRAHDGALDVLYASGGNFLETLPDPDYVREALARVPLRVHQDIVLSSAMLVEPAERAILLPAMTRYEQPGGGTETSTERRILFSPEVPGPRPGEVRPEWWIFTEIAARVRPERAGKIRFRDAKAIREEIARVVPAYAGIENLEKTGDQVQWGGRILCAGGRFDTADGKARFASVASRREQAPLGKYTLTTRRGKQFNSMVQAERDPLTGLHRRAVLMSAEDVERQGLRDGEEVVLRSDAGEGRFVVAVGPILPGNVQVVWPEGNRLIRRGVREPSSGIPAYKAVVDVIKLS